MRPRSFPDRVAERANALGASGIVWPQARGRFFPRGVVSHVWGADKTSSSSIDVTKVFGPSPSKQMVVRPPLVPAVTPIPKTEWLTRWPSPSPRSAWFEGRDGATGGSGDRGRGGVRGTYGGLAVDEEAEEESGEGVDEGVHDRCFGTGVCAVR